MHRRGRGAAVIPLVVMAGGALGSVARYGLAVAVGSLMGQGFPWGTILINILGSFVIGWFGGVTGPNGRHAVPEAMRAFVMIGICGGFTTFSSFSLQTMELLRAGYTGRALANVVASVTLCLMATTLGLRLSQS
jgi:CrcB protein